MITIFHPSLLQTITAIPLGLLPLRFSGEATPCLVVKVPKEYILAAKINKSFKIYLVPVLIDNVNVCCAISAFFDDIDEPLVLRTPLFNRMFDVDFFEVLNSRSVKIHFFDELSRERLVYEATVTIPEETKRKIQEFKGLEFSIYTAKVVLDGALQWFGQRTTEDDACAIDISLDRSVYSEDLFIQDMRPEAHSYHGSRGHSHAILEIEAPGRYQEEAIVQCLLLVFSPEQIFLNPKRTYDREEICDILIVTDSRVLIIQAKDSPRIERIIRQKLERKRINVKNALNKAVDQVKGAIRYCRSKNNVLEFLINDEPYTFDTRKRDINSLIVVKELFNDQYHEYSPILLNMIREKEVPCIVLDYPEFYQYCVHLRGEQSFFNAYTTVMECAIKNNAYPRLRFGLAERKQ